MMVSTDHREAWQGARHKEVLLERIARDLAWLLTWFLFPPQFNVVTSIDEDSHQRQEKGLQDKANLRTILLCFSLFRWFFFSPFQV